MTSGDETEIGALSRRLGERLHQDDAEALREIFNRFASAVAARLKNRFGRVLGETDVDDILSQALVRVWKYRHRYDPQRASLFTWYYMIARSRALEVARRRSDQPWVFFSDLSPVQQSGLAAAVEETAEQSDSSEPENLAAPPPEMIALRTFLTGLEDRDRQILLAFAEHEGREAWATALAEKWQMPAATIRSKKRRAMIRLREALELQGFTFFTGDTPMSALAPHSFARLPQFAHYTFVQEHSDAAEELARRFKEYHDSLDGDMAKQGFTHFTEMWNEAYDSQELEDPRKRALLVATYRWLAERAAREDRYRNQLAAFIALALKSADLQESEFARQAPAAQLDRIETSMAGVAQLLEAALPDDVATEGMGRLFLRWSDNEAQVSWRRTLEAPISLRAAATRGFSLYGQLPMREAACLAEIFLQNVRTNRGLLPPNFAFPSDINTGAPPAQLLWSVSTESNLQADNLPGWIHENTRNPEELPSEVELDIAQRDPELDQLLDKLLSSAALSDMDRQPAEERSTQRAEEATTSAVRQLVEFVAYAANCPRQEVAEIFSQYLRVKQSHISDGEKCRANTEALLFLWSQLAEQQ